MRKLSYYIVEKNLRDVMQQLNEDKNAVMVTTEDDSNNAVLVSLDEYNAMMETIYLLQSPENARRLFESLEQIR
ncbi:type II toxin-antitoxin system Phd/YefM family antitoxin [Aerococcaceae bacterium DSM 111176]|nr:type II toxin-antitoxin system Phd/YefM family antitoxin [Aerococcaceae bacterium DSM 111176]